VIRALCLNSKSVEDSRARGNASKIQSLPGETGGSTQKQKKFFGIGGEPVPETEGGSEKRTSG